MSTLGKFNKQSLQRIANCELYNNPCKHESCSLPENTATLQLDAIAPLRVMSIQRGEDKCHRLTSDVFLLLHKEDVLKRLGGSLDKYFGEPVKASSFQQAIDGMSDEQIFETIRPRYIQSPAEIKARSDMINEEAEKIEKQAKDLFEDAAQQAAQQAAADSNNNSTSE